VELWTTVGRPGRCSWQGGGVDWDEQVFALLDDLEQQAEALYAADRAGELADRSRAEYAAVTLASRLMASIGQELLVEVSGPGQVAGVLQRVGADWCLVHGPAQDWLVRLAAVVAVEAPPNARFRRWPGHRSRDSGSARHCAVSPTPVSAACSTPSTEAAARSCSPGWGGTSSRHRWARAGRCCCPWTAWLRCRAAAE
jgi:hypothetical protein